jgi:hypothetical protein
MRRLCVTLPLLVSAVRLSGARPHNKKLRRPPELFFPATPQHTTTHPPRFARMMLFLLKSVQKPADSDDRLQRLRRDVRRFAPLWSLAPLS